MKYQGYDWTELAKEFGTFENEFSEDIILEKTKDYLKKQFLVNSAILVNEIKLFLSQLYAKCLEGEKCNAPIWKGMLEITDDYTLVKYTIILLEHMWY